MGENILKQFTLLIEKTFSSKKIKKKWIYKQAAANQYKLSDTKTIVIGAVIAMLQAKNFER